MTYGITWEWWMCHSVARLLKSNNQHRKPVCQSKASSQPASDSENLHFFDLRWKVLYGSLVCYSTQNLSISHVHRQNEVKKTLNVFTLPTMVELGKAALANNWICNCFLLVSCRTFIGSWHMHTRVRARIASFRPLLPIYCPSYGLFDSVIVADHFCLLFHLSQQMHAANTDETCKLKWCANRNELATFCLCVSSCNRRHC